MSAEGAALKSCFARKECRPYGPPFNPEDLNHGLTAVANKCHAFGALERLILAQKKGPAVRKAFLLISSS